VKIIIDYAILVLRRADEDMRLSFLFMIISTIKRPAEMRCRHKLSAGSPESTDLATQVLPPLTISQSRFGAFGGHVDDFLLNDRVLTPEMMRAMIILYIGPHNVQIHYGFSPVPILAQKRY